MDATTAAALLASVECNCDITAKLIADATIGWLPTTHWLHHGKVREAVRTVLLLATRLEKEDDAAITAGIAPNELTLPTEVWYLISGFFLRSWWDPVQPEPTVTQQCLIDSPFQEAYGMISMPLDGSEAATWM